MSLHYWDTTLPTVRSTIGDLVADHQRNISGMRTVWECIEANAEAVADVERDGRGSYGCRGLAFDLESNEARLCSSAWRGLLDRLNLEYALSCNRMDEVRAQIEKNDTPEFNEANVCAMIESLAAGLPEYFREACKEVCEWVRPWRDEYVTNRRNATNEIGAKIIKGGMVNNWGYGFNLNYRCEDKLRCLDNVFSLLDGAGVQRYPGDLVTTIKAAMQEGEQIAETERFRCQWFKNGNMHIEFLRSDLLREFNSIAHGNIMRNPFAPKADEKGPTEKKRYKHYTGGQSQSKTRQSKSKTAKHTPRFDFESNSVLDAIQEIKDSMTKGE